MNIKIADSRYVDVLKSDSLNSNPSDFMLTHVPFNKINNVKLNGAETDNVYTEEEVLKEFLLDDERKDQHQLIIVKGSTGSGKSHFIRWLYMKLLASHSNDVPILIRRENNTLKSTLAQLLEIKELESLKDKEVYKKLVSANKTISEAEFKGNIYYSFINKIETTEELGELSNVTKKRLAELLKNSYFKERLYLDDGPIDRIFSKVAGGKDTGSDVKAYFEEADFTLSTEFVEDMEAQGADRKAVSIANKLIPEDGDDDTIRKITQYINLFVEDVIQSSAGISSGDLSQVFSAIRKEIKSQGKNLILLIEDITSFTGVNEALLEALITEHTGEHEGEGLCRLTSVVGTTNDYYDVETSGENKGGFRGHYKQRVTAEFEIKDKTINPEDGSLYLFFAKYLNAISVSKNDADNWYRNGAVYEDTPIHKPDIDWEKIYINGAEEGICLYPFTKSAIFNLFYHLPKEMIETPRRIIQNVIIPAVSDIIKGVKDFPSFIGYIPAGLFPSTLESTFDRKYVGGQKDRVKRIVAFWGDWNKSHIKENTINYSYSNERNFLGFLGRNILNNLGINEFDSIEDPISTGSGTNLVPEDNPIPEPEPFIAPKDPKIDYYRKFDENVIKWYDNNEEFTYIREVREQLDMLILDSLDWQSEGVSNSEVKLFDKEKTYNFISIEGESRGIQRLYQIKRNYESRDLIRAIGRYSILGNHSWKYENAEDDIALFTQWLYKNKKIFVSIVREAQREQIPAHIKASILLDIYYLVLSGNCKSAKDINADLFLRSIPQPSEKSNHNVKWNDILKKVREETKQSNNHFFCLDYFNLTMGDGGKQYVINYLKLEQAINELISDGFTFNTSETTKIKGRLEKIETYTDVSQKIPEVITTEKETVEKLIQNLYDHMGVKRGFEISKEDIVELVDDVKNFYTEVYHIGVTTSHAESKSFDIYKKERSSYADIINKYASIITTTSDILSLMEYVDDPTLKLMPLSTLLNNAEIDVKQAESRIDTLLSEINDKTGISSMSEDKSQFDAAYQKLQEMIK